MPIRTEEVGREGHEAADAALDQLLARAAATAGSVYVRIKGGPRE